MSRTAVEPILLAVQVFISQGGTYSDICRSLNWSYRDKPDTAKLRRALGLKTNTGGRNANGEHYRYQNQTMNSQTAGEIVRAIGRDPREFDV